MSKKVIGIFVFGLFVLCFVYGIVFNHIGSHKIMQISSPTVNIPDTATPQAGTFYDDKNNSNIQSSNLDLKASTTTDEVVIPESFGAVGNGQTDDCKAIVKALNYAIENKKTLLFDKSYYISHTIVLQNNANGLTIEGTDGATIYSKDTAFYLLSDLTRKTSNITFKNLHLVGKNTQGDGMDQTWGIVGFTKGNTDGFDNIRIENVITERFKVSGIHFDNATLTMENVISKNNGFHGFTFRRGIVNISGLVAEGNKELGIDCSAGTDPNSQFNLTDFTLQGNAIGMKQDGTWQINLSNGKFISNNKKAPGYWGVGFVTMSRALGSVVMDNIQSFGHINSGMIFNRPVAVKLSNIDMENDNQANNIEGAFYYSDSKETIRINNITLNGCGVRSMYIGSPNGIIDGFNITNSIGSYDRVIELVGNVALKNGSIMNNNAIYGIKINGNKPCNVDLYKIVVGDTRKGKEIQKYGITTDGPNTINCSIKESDFSKCISKMVGVISSNTKIEKDGSVISSEWQTKN